MANGHGGKREGSGRRPKEQAQELVENLTPMSADAYKALESAVKTGQPWAVKLWMEYMHGKPLQKTENSHTGELNTIPITSWLDSQES